MSTDYHFTPTLDKRLPKTDSRARLVILVDKRLAQKSRVDPETEIELLPIDLNLDNLRDSYKSLTKGWFRRLRNKVKH